MHKLWVLARNEVLRTFRDTGAVLMMIAAPLVLILVLLAAFGKGEETPIQDVSHCEKFCRLQWSRMKLRRGHRLMLGR